MERKNIIIICNNYQRNDKFILLHLSTDYDNLFIETINR